MTQLLIAIISGGMLGWIIKSHLNDLAKRNLVDMNIPSDEGAEMDSMDTTQTDETQMPDGVKVKPGSSLDYGEINRAYRMADMHFARGDLAEAEKWFIKVIALHEHHPEALNRLGVIYIQQNNPRRAEILYQKLLSVHQKEAAYYANYGRCLYNQKKLDGAIAAYKRAVELDPSRPARFVSLGQIYYETNELKPALEYFTRALELDPNNLEYLLLVADLAETIDDRQQQFKALKKIVELDPYNKPARDKFNALIRMG